jgi:GT2 family glycosyltransferase
MTSVLIVVLNWNGLEDTLRCVDSLLKQTYKKYEILIVDNGSKGGAPHQLDELSELHSNISIIKNPVNLGFSGGVNTGIRYAIEKNFDAVALFNNDAIADKKWLSELVVALGNKDVSASTGLLLREDGKTIDSTGDFYSTWGMPFPRNRGDKVAKAPESGYVFGATGGATLYRTSLFKEIGLFDESFFAYYEDVDVSFRAQLAGHKVYFTNEAIAYHKQGATSKKIPGFTVYQTFKNLPLLFIKNVPAGLFMPICARLLVLYWLFFFNAIRKGSGWYALKGWLASVWYFWTKSLWDRFAIQRKKVVSTEYIRGLLWHDLPPDQTGMRSLHAKLTGRR